METAAWAQLKDEELLEQKISRLELKLESTAIYPLIQQLYSELDQKGLSFHPPCHIGDEWFCPVGIPAIFIPFFLVHERLRQLEYKMILEVEGETPDWFMQLIRHEAAHAYCYAYQLHRKRKWQQVFGRPSAEDTPSYYRPRPYSRSFVIHLDNWYAQSNADEDFAETFAVWLTPGMDWRARYRGWKALQKIEYVDELMKSIAGKPPVHVPKYRHQDHNCLNVKLKTYYTRKRKQYEDSYPEFYDRDLSFLFPGNDESGKQTKASRYLRAHRREIMNAVSKWTSERKYSLNELLGMLIERCEDLELRASSEDPKQLMNVATYVATLVMNNRFTGRFKRTK